MRRAESFSTESVRGMVNALRAQLLLGLEPWAFHRGLIANLAWLPIRGRIGVASLLVLTTRN